MKDKIILLLKEGKTYNEIQKLLGCAKSTISYHASKIGLGKTRTIYNWNEIRSYYESSESVTITDCIAKFGFSKASWDKAVARGDIVSKVKKLTLDDVLVENCKHSRLSLKRLLLKYNILDYKCAICSINTWNNEFLSLELDHINGVYNDNRLENLRFLCPNCHSQTPTHGAKNIIFQRNINNLSSSGKM